MNYEQLTEVLRDNRCVVSIHGIDNIEDAIAVIESVTDEKPEISVQPTAFAVRAEDDEDKIDITVFVSR